MNEHICQSGQRAIVTRNAMYSPMNRRRPYSWYYETKGPDGANFTNTSIVTLRRLLKQRYGKSIVIVENYDKSITLVDYLPGGRMAK